MTAEQLAFIREMSDETSISIRLQEDTDTELAWRLASSRNPEQILNPGALGTRFDHSLANVHLLRTALRQGVSASIMDEHNCIQLASEGIFNLINKGFTYISLLPLTERVTGITRPMGFQYPLHEADASEIGQ